MKTVDTYVKDSYSSKVIIVTYPATPLSYLPPSTLDILKYLFLSMAYPYLLSRRYILEIFKVSVPLLNLTYLPVTTVSTKWYRLLYLRRGYQLLFLLHRIYRTLAKGNVSVEKVQHEGPHIILPTRYARIGNVSVEKVQHKVPQTDNSPHQSHNIVIGSSSSHF